MLLLQIIRFGTFSSLFFIFTVRSSKIIAKILRPSYPFLALLRLLVLHGPHDEEQEEAVQQADQGQNDEGDGLPAELVEDAPEWRRHQAPKRDEGESDAQGLGALRLLCVPGGHGLINYIVTKAKCRHLKRKTRRMEDNAKCGHLTKFTCKRDFCGRCLSV
jgi:hypothetical protein